MKSESNDLPVVVLKKQEERRLKQGHLWVYSNEIDTLSTPLNGFESGQLVQVLTSQKQVLGVGYINPHSLISVRLLSRGQNARLEKAFLKKRLQAAQALREMHYNAPYYRLVFGESDGLPGLVIDRFGDVFSVQITTAGMEAFKDEIIETLVNLFKPEAVVFRNDSSARAQEGLPSYNEVAFGAMPETVQIEENGTQFQIPIEEGQKTGWFYDHREARRLLQPLVAGKRVLDVFSYLGGWGLEMMQAGAETVTCVDASSSALDALERNAQLNGVSDAVTTYEGNAFDVLKALIAEQQKFDVVIVDPPAFIKRKKDVKSGLEGYRRINELALRLVEPGGILVSASCSYHLKRDQLLQLVQRSARHLDKSVQLFAQGHQGPDHPIHPAIEETEYLKSLFFRLQKSGYL